jgi:hypothetical protein
MGFIGEFDLDDGHVRMRRFGQKARKPVFSMVRE